MKLIRVTISNTFDLSIKFTAGTLLLNVFIINSHPARSTFSTSLIRPKTLPSCQSRSILLDFGSASLGYPMADPAFVGKIPHPNDRATPVTNPLGEE